MNANWMNDFSQPQKRNSSRSTMKNGTKMGPKSAQTAVAIIPNVMTHSAAAFANTMTRSINQYKRLAKMPQVSGCTKRLHSSSRCAKVSSSERASRILAKLLAWSVIKFEKEI